MGWRGEIHVRQLQRLLLIAWFDWLFVRMVFVASSIAYDAVNFCILDVAFYDIIASRQGRTGYTAICLKRKKTLTRARGVEG